MDYHHRLLLFLLSSATFFAGAADTNTTPTILRTICSTNQTQTPQPFDVNFVNSMELVFQSIASTGFGFAVSGSASNTVYGIGQCFGYLSSIDCRLCYAESRVKLPHCLPSTDGRIYLDGCFLRYADRNVSAEAVDGSDASVCGNSSAGAWGSVQFSQKAIGLVGNLTSAAYKEKDYFVVGREEVSPGVVVYGMAQCWRSLNRSGCQECLEKAGKNVSQCLPAMDGKAMNAGCFVRYSADPFYLSPASNNGEKSPAFRHRLGAALGSVFAALAVTIIVVIWRRKPTDRSDDIDGSSEFIKSISASNLSFKYEDLTKATDNFAPVNKLGQGGYGSVYKGILPDGREIAVKRLFLNAKQWVDQFFNEVKLISQVQHKNLVKLLGCSTEGPESLLVYEYLCNTSLDKYLFDSFKKSALDWERRFNVILGTAEGITYLHDASEVRIIHRDIKASNILLDERFRPKIADFGLARCFAEDQSHLSTGLAGTFGYMAPEYVIHGQLTEKADVYGYGVLILEVLTGRKNQNSIARSAEGHSLMSLIWKHYTEKTLIDLLDTYLQGQCPEEQALKVFHIGLLCTQSTPSRRPPMWKVVEMLNSKSMDFPLPTQPPFINVKGADNVSQGSQASYMSSSVSKSPVSVNQMSVSIIRGR